jgi:hypothetical protein
MSIDYFDSGIGYGELDLECFIQFLIDTGNGSLEVETFPDREALQHLVDRLGWLRHKLAQGPKMISISHCGMYRVDGLSPAELFRLAVCAFEVGSFTCSDSSEVIAARWRAEKARAAPSEWRTTSAEINRIIDDVVDGHRPGDAEGRGAQKAIVSEAQTKLAERGYALKEESVRGRVQRRLKARS